MLRFIRSLGWEWSSPACLLNFNQNWKNTCISEDVMTEVEQSESHLEPRSGSDKYCRTIVLNQNSSGDAEDLVLLVCGDGVTNTDWTRWWNTNVWVERKREKPIQLKLDWSSVEVQSIQSIDIQLHDLLFLSPVSTHVVNLRESCVQLSVLL